MNSKHIKRYAIEVIQRKHSGFIPLCLRFFFRIASVFYRGAVSMRNWVYDQGWLSRFSPPVPIVISVGNIVAGGTGKTPVTLLLAKQFYDEFIIALLSRGYRSKAEHQPRPLCLSNGMGPLHRADTCGDEPFLLAENLPHALVYVGKDRHASSIMAVQAGAQMIILDDGMQYRRLARDIDIVVMDNNDLFGQGHFLPRGFLREGISSLRRAHLIIINHIDNEEQLRTAQARIAPYSQAPLVGTAMFPVGARLLNGDTVPTLSGMKVALFCGIAHPEYFKKSVSEQGALIVAENYVGDHESFTLPTLEAFALQAKEMEAELLLCTEKDKVKFLTPPKLALPVAWLQMELKVIAGNKAWNKFIQKTKSDILRRI
jgi:tetraacyldisaccharide 4'-kinase